MLFVLQKWISASQRRVRTEEFVIIPQEDTRADAQLTTLEITVIVSVILLYFIICTCFVVVF